MRAALTAALPHLGPAPAAVNAETRRKMARALEIAWRNTPSPNHPLAAVDAVLALLPQSAVTDAVETRPCGGDTPQDCAERPSPDCPATPSPDLAALAEAAAQYGKYETREMRAFLRAYAADRRRVQQAACAVRDRKGWINPNIRALAVALAGEVTP
jgi:hypothetical protein